MEHPNLTTEETKVARAHLSAELLRRRIPAERWAHVTLGVVVDLAGQTLRLVERDTERPAAPLFESEPP